MMVAAIVYLGLGCDVALAAESRVAYLAMMFPAESHSIRTTACLQVTERLYAQSKWWENTSGNADASERAFKAVIAAIARNDRDALLKLSDPAERADLKSFDAQAGAFFQQFKAGFELVDVPRGYEFDGLSVYFAIIRFKDETAAVPFMFAAQDDGAFGFLPSKKGRLNQSTFVLVQDWMNAGWGSRAAGSPTYCTDAAVARATHRFPVSASSGTTRPVRQPTYLLITGASLDAPGARAGLGPRITSAVERLKSALASGAEDAAKLMASEGANSLTKWYGSATREERVRYQATITAQSPFFFFDASPLLVVYTRSPGDSIQVLYFTIGPGNELLWTNSSYITVADKVFKSDASYDSARLKPAFSNRVTK